MAVEQILGHLAGHDLAIGIEQVGIPSPLLRGHLERHVQELADVGIELGVHRHVPDGGGEPRPTPAVDFRSRRQLCAVDIDHRRIRPAEVVDVVEGVGVDLPGEHEAVAAGLGQPDQFLEPGRPGRLQMHAGARGREHPPDHGIERELVAA